MSQTRYKCVSRTPGACEPFTPAQVIIAINYMTFNQSGGGFIVATLRDLYMYAGLSKTASALMRKKVSMEMFHQQQSGLPTVKLVFESCRMLCAIPRLIFSNTTLLL